MAGGKETPRQKMIGMMYLVLMAMLALNVSAEVLNAFVSMDEGLLRTIGSLSEKNNDKERQFQKGYSENPERIGPWLNKAKQLRQSSQDLLKFIRDLKIDLVKEGDGEAIALENGAITPDGNVITSKIQSKDKTDAPSRLLVEGLALTRPDPQGPILQEKINAYRDQLIAMLDKSPKFKDRTVQLEKTLKDMFDTNDVVSGTDAAQTKEWYRAMFLDMPLVGVMPLLTKIEVDVLNAESDMLNYFWGMTDATTVKIDRFDPVVISQGDYILKGGEFKAQIFLAASDQTLVPSVRIGGSSLRVENGRGIYSTVCNNIGEQTIKGTISIQDKSYDFVHKYMVAEPNFVVSPTKMNVFYRGVDNPIEVSAGGVPDDKVQIQVTNANTKKDKGALYVLKPLDGNSCEITVLAEMNGRMSNLGKKIFRIKNLPNPNPEVDGIKGKVATKGQFSSAQGLRAAMPADFDFEAKYTVKGFTVSAVVDGFSRDASSTSMAFTNEQKSILSKVQTNGKVSITDIKAQGPDGRTVELSDLVFTVK